MLNKIFIYVHCYKSSFSDVLEMAYYVQNTDAIG